MANAVCHVVIVGCGLGGLAAAIALKRQGHDVTMLEQAARLSEIGAGIQIPPNSARILRSWGLLDEVMTYAVEPEALVLRAHGDGAVLFQSRIVPNMWDDYGVPWLLIHRADYFGVLVREARRLGVCINVNCAVTRINCSNASILVGNSAGPDIEADVVVGADGLRSKCRGMIRGSEEPRVVRKGYVNRVSVSDEAIRAHAELVGLLGGSVTNTWVGRGAHVATYPVRGSDTYNFVFICDVLLESLDDMKTFFQTWDPRLRLVLDLATEVKTWPLIASSGTERWIHEEGNFALLGDACHAMFPFLAQGAAQAVEDGAVLGVVLGDLRQKNDIRDRLLLYERLRRPRANKVRDLSEGNLQIFHMLGCKGGGGEGEGEGEGEKEGECDGGIKSLPAFGEEGKGHENWAEAGFCDWLFGHDVVEEAVEMRGMEKGGEEA